MLRQSGALSMVSADGFCCRAVSQALIFSQLQVHLHEPYSSHIQQPMYSQMLRPRGILGILCLCLCLAICTAEEPAPAGVAAAATGDASGIN
jgi:hypothetical protein